MPEFTEEQEAALNQAAQLLFDAGIYLTEVKLDGKAIQFETTCEGLILR